MSSRFLVRGGTRLRGIERNFTANAPRSKYTRKCDAVVVGLAGIDAPGLFSVSVSKVEHAIRVSENATLLAIFGFVRDDTSTNRIIRATNLEINFSYTVA